MKKFLIICLLLLLTACEEEENDGYDYEDLDNVQVTSYMEGETMEEKYVLYYYSETCPACNNVKQEVIPFFMDFDLLEVYLLNVGEMMDVSLFTEFVGTPSLFVIDGAKNLYETYIGADRVREFMVEYEDFRVDMSHLSSSEVLSLEDYQSLEEGTYTLLYSKDAGLSQDLINNLFGLASSSLVLIPIEDADQDLLDLFEVNTYPSLMVNEEELLVLEGEQVIVEYFEE